MSDTGKRMTKLPTRLTYFGLGQQGESSKVAGLQVGMQKSVLSPAASPFNPLTLYNSQQQNSSGSVFGARASSSASKSVKGSRPSQKSATTKTRNLEIQAKEELLKLRHEYEDDLDKLKDKQEDLRKRIRISKDEIEKCSFQDDLQDVEIMIQRLERDYKKKQTRVQEYFDLHKEKIMIDSEEDTSLEDEELSKVDRTENWVDEQNRENIEEMDAIVPQPCPPLPEAEAPNDDQQQGPSDPVTNLVSAMEGVFRKFTGENEWKPKDLPIFNGKAEDWPIFVNEFRRTTPAGKENSSQNAIRLRKALKGVAREAVVGLLNDPANNSRILKTLEVRFGRGELVIRALLKKAEDCKPPDMVKPETFVDFATTVVHLVECITSLKEERYLYDATLMDKLVSKMPLTYSAEWITFLQANPTLPKNFATFGKWVESKMNVLVELVHPVIKEEKEQKGKVTRGSATINVTSAETTADQGKCVCCNKNNHNVNTCYKFKKLKVTERENIGKKAGLCYKCLGSGHMIKDCSVDKVCGKGNCKGSHHVLLHWENKSPKKSSRDKTKTVSGVEEKTNEEKPSTSVSGSSTEEDQTVNIGATQSDSSKPLSVV